MLLLRADRQREAMEAYAMSGIRRIVYGILGKNADFPSYFDYVNDLRKPVRTRANTDRRSAAQITQDIINGLRGIKE